jgi:hypothetical protein
VKGCENQALVDMVVGKQKSIKGALRVESLGWGFPMKILSFNYRGVASPVKKYSLKRLVESSRPDIITYSRNNGGVKDIVRLCITFKHWNFIGVDANGHLGDLAIGWNQKVKILNSWGFESGMGVEACHRELGEVFQILNVYGPYADHVQFWEALFRKSFL